MSGLSKSDYDYINLGVCIKGQADRLGIEHEGIPLEGVVVRLANATPPGSEQADREPSDAAVGAAARAMAHADVTNPDGWVMSEEARNVYSDKALRIARGETSERRASS